MCLTISSISALSLGVHPSRFVPSGKIAYWNSFGVCIVVPRIGGDDSDCSCPFNLDSASFSFASSFKIAKRFNVALSLSIVRASCGVSSESLYLGRRSINLPSEGTKSEFWTLVRVESVETSGSLKS
jgi:hypothetical protein